MGPANEFGGAIEAAEKLHEAHPRSHITDNWCCGCMAFDPIRERAP